MSDWLLALAGTPAGVAWASVFALVSAFAHALFGALQKGRHDPWLARGAIDLALVVLTIPMVLLVPMPSFEVFVILLGAMAVHFVYKVMVALAYERGAYTVVYPVIRGTGPLVTVAVAMVLFQERYGVWQWVGVLALSGGILGLALRNLSEERIDPGRLKRAILFAMAGGVVVAGYTVYDAWGIRVAADPLAFLAWFFFLTSFDFALIGLWRWRGMADRPAPGPLMFRGVSGALIAYVSFGGVMLATRIGNVGQAAVLRETSVLFAAGLGALFLKERVGPRKAALMALIAGGAVLMQAGVGE